MHVVCNDSFQCTSYYKPRPLHHENQPGLPDFSACNIEKYGEASPPGYEDMHTTPGRKTCTFIVHVHLHVQVKQESYVSFGQQSSCLS